jgi:hypothetical protein
MNKMCNKRFFFYTGFISSHVFHSHKYQFFDKKWSETHPRLLGSLWLCSLKARETQLLIIINNGLGLNNIIDWATFWFLGFYLYFLDFLDFSGRLRILRAFIVKWFVMIRNHFVFLFWFIFFRYITSLEALKTLAL